MIETLFPFLKTFFGNTSSTSGIYLWLKTTLKTATHLKKSIPGLRKSKSRVTGIHVVKNKNDFKFFVQVFNKVKIMSTVTNHFFLFYNFCKLIFQCSSIEIIQFRSKQGYTNRQTWRLTLTWLNWWNRQIYLRNQQIVFSFDHIFLVGKVPHQDPFFYQ